MHRTIHEGMYSIRIKNLGSWMILFQLIQHLFMGLHSGDSRLWMPHCVSFLHDLLLISTSIVFVRLMIRIIGPRLQQGAGIAGLNCVLVIGLALSIYPQLLREYLAFPVNVFATDAATAQRMLTEYLGIQRLWPVVIAALFGIFAMVKPIHIRPSRPCKVALNGLMAILTLAAIITLPRSPNPLITSISLQIGEALGSSSRVVPPLKRSPTSESASTSHDLPATSIDQSLADHIFLIVLEGVTAQDFESNFFGRKNGFYHRVMAHTACFRNYHTTNLDSYTSLIAMLTSVQVPYRAYADVTIYEKVNEADNLTRVLRTHGHYGLFISTYSYQPYVPTRKDWDCIMTRQDLPSIDGWVSLGTNRMEQATEDRAALQTMTETAETHARSFILHEMVYGHSPEWEAATGKNRIAYIDEYLNDLLDRLEARGLYQRSLLVIVSDHGDRVKAADRENYRVPLLVVGKDVAPLSDDEFRSHLDLQNIIVSYMNGSPLPSPRSEIHVVGSTERWIYGKITADRQYVFIDDKTGSRLTSFGNLNPINLYHDFQTAIDLFGNRVNAS